MDLVGPRSTTFINQLSQTDLARLRRAAFRIMDNLRYPQELRTKREADRMIEAYGPETAERVIERAVNRGLSA